MGTKTHPRTHLLIDGDIIAFSSAAAAQSIWVDDAGWHQPIASEREGEAIVENMLFGIKKGLKADSFEVIISDTDNWRKLVDPEYKMNRSDSARPLLLGYLKEYLVQKHGAYSWPGLEADDVLGIKMTWPREATDGQAYQTPDSEWIYGIGSERRRLICVGRDKDFKSIPGLHHALKQDVGPKGEMLVREVSQWEADRFHMIQTLAGDRVDGYYGCPGIGMDRAATIIDCPVLLVPKAGMKTRGVNKGEATLKWVAEPTMDYWACIVSHYQKGLSSDQGQCSWEDAEREALRTARLARILRYGEYDRETEEVTLWTPDKLKEVRRV